MIPFQFHYWIFDCVATSDNGGQIGFVLTE